MLYFLLTTGESKVSAKHMAVLVDIYCCSNKSNSETQIGRPYAFHRTIYASKDLEA